MTSSLPKVGIRPTIDGRRKGVRESLEEQTMAMARARRGAHLSAKLRHPCGDAVECVIADTCIGGVAEAAACAAEFARAERRRVADRHALLVLRLRDHGHGPADAQGRLGLQRHRAARRGLPGGRPGGAQPEGPARLRHLRPRRAGRRRHRPSPPTSREKILRFARAGLAVATMRGKSYLSVGNVSMGIAGSHRRPRLLRALPRHARSSTST